MKNKYSSLIILGILLCFFSSLVYAQRLTGTIRGTVKDETGAVLPGVTVEIESPALIGGIQSATSSERGIYIFRALAPGTYTVTYSMEGFQTIKRENIVVSVGKTTTIDINMRISAVEETITVTAEAPLVDVTKSGTTTTYNLDLLDNLPMTRYTYIDIMMMAPGVSANETGGEEWHSSLGSSYWSDSYLVDGVDTSFDWNGTTWVWNNPDIYVEGEVFAIGAPAEYGNFQGAIVNVVTKSGGNDFAGQANAYLIAPGMVGNNTPDEEYPYYIDHWRDISLQLGGPFKKDRIWYYGNVQYKRYAYSQVGTPPDYPTLAKYDRFFVKATIQLTENHKLMASYQHEWCKLPDVITPAQPFDACADEPGNYGVPNLMLTSVLGPNTLLEVKYGGWYAHDEWVPMDGNLDEPCHYDGATGYVTNGIWGWYKGDISRSQFNVNLSHYADDFIKGNHDIKFGIQYSRGTGHGLGSYSGGVAYYDYDGEPYLAYFQNPYEYGNAIHRMGFFVDDAWTISDRLTLNLGLRFDHQDGDIWDAPELDVNRNRTGNEFSGIEDVLVWRNWSPRFGLVYQLTADKKTILRLNYGQYYEGMYLATFFRLTPSYPPVSAYAYNWDNGQYDILEWIWYSTEGLGTADEVKSSLCQQFSVGFNRELFPDFALEVTYIYKYTKDGLSWRNTAGTFEQVSYLDEYSGNMIQVWNQTNDPGDDFLTLMNDPNLKQKYQGVFITLQKRLSNNWQMSSSFVISKAYGVSASSSQLSQSGFSGLENPNDLINNSGWDGLLQSDRTYAFKLQGSYFLPYDISISASYQAQSGKPIARTISVRGMGQGPFSVLAEPRGKNWRLDSWSLLDLRIEKTLHFTDRYGARIALDIFNLFNEATMIETLTTRGLAEGFMKPARVASPRRIMLGLRLMF